MRHPALLWSGLGVLAVPVALYAALLGVGVAGGNDLSGDQPSGGSAWVMLTYILGQVLRVSGWWRRQREPLRRSLEQAAAQPVKRGGIEAEPGAEVAVEATEVPVHGVERFLQVDGSRLQ